jgi:predicted transcriptional regulator of viral defense system
VTSPKQPRETSPTSEIPDLFRARDLEELGLPKSRLNAWVRECKAERIERGLYRRTDAEGSELETIAMVAKRVPRAVVCLLTALRVHEIGTQSPHSVWIALDRKARVPRLAPARLRVVRFAPRLMKHGVERREVLGVTIHITSPARTIVDCFRYRRKVGLDVALEALSDGLRRKRVTVSQLIRAAEVASMVRVMKPYLESLTR